MSRMRDPYRSARLEGFRTGVFVGAVGTMLLMGFCFGLIIAFDEDITDLLMR
ncbi:MAG: hypothetical protein AAF557_15965 [Pseudomonadota bacterium]